MRYPYVYLDGSVPVLMVCGQSYRLSKKELESLSHDIGMASNFLNNVTIYKDVENVGKTAQILGRIQV